MNYQEGMEKIYDEVQNKLAEGISTIIRDIYNKEGIVDFLRNMEDQPTVDVLFCF